MRYWLLRRPPLYGDITPNSANTPWEYDKVSVNPRLKPGDIVYLIAAYHELYGWGHVEKKQSYQDIELNGRAYKITVTRPVVQILTSREEVKSIPELAPLFETSVNFAELNARQVSLLNRLLASKGVITPPDMVADEVSKLTASIQDFPRVEVSPEVRIWLCAAYDRLKAGKKVDPQEMVVELWQQIPDFNYQAIDRRLMLFGVELTLLGILLIDPTTELFDETDHVIRFVKQKIQKEPKVENVTAEEVSEALELKEDRVSLIFSLMNHLGHFWNGAAGSANFPGYTSIRIDHESIKREYLKYERLEPLLERFAKTGEESTKAASEPAFAHTLLDWRFGERLEDAVSWINRLPAKDLLAYDTETLTKAVERFAITPPMVRTDKAARDERTVELEDLALDRKTGGTGHSFLIPIEGEADWFEEVRMQIVVADGHPLAFLDKERSWIYVRLTVLLEDPEGTLKQKLNERLAIINQYAAYVSKRIIEFNNELADRMTEQFNRRKNGIVKAKNETEAIGLPTAYNPKNSETEIKVERLMQRLNARFTRPLTYAEQLFEEVKALAETHSVLDVETAKLLIEKADDALKEFGNTKQEEKIQLRKWKAQAELILPPSTIDDLRRRAEGELLKRSYPRNPVLRKLLLAGVAMTVIVLSALVIKQQLVKRDSTPSAEYSTQMPSPLASPTGLTNSVMSDTAHQKPQPTILSSGELRTACIQSETSKTFFDDTVTVGTGGISFEGSPLRHLVDVVVSSPGYHSEKYPHQQNGDKITYRGMGVFEITVASTDTFQACFSIRRFHEKSVEEKSVR